MSTSTLTGLRDYLYDTLSPANMLWLATELTKYAQKEERPPFRRYTKDEINAMLDEAERQIAAGETVSDEETWHKYDEEFSREEFEMAEVV